MQKLNFLFLGAGYASIAALKAIRKEYFERANFTLVSAHDYHYHTVLLHTTAACGANVCYSLSKILDSKVKFIQDCVLQLKENSVILANNGEISGQDFIISALGFSSESFGIKGISEHSLAITSFDSAMKIHQKITQNFSNFKTSNDPNDLRVIVCGGGLTGVEFASELAVFARDFAKKNGIDSSKIKIFIIEAMPKILPMYAENLVSKAYKRLTSLGVEVKNNAKILECFEGGIKIDGQPDLRANAIIWTAGVKGNEIIAKSEFKNGRSKVEIGTTLQNIEGLYPKYFFAGDNSCLKDSKAMALAASKGDNRAIFLPPTAQLSVKEGEFLAKNIMNLIDSKPLESSFDFSPKASFCSLGSGYAIGYAYNFNFSGKLASLMKHFIEKQWVNTILR